MAKRLDVLEAELERLKGVASSGVLRVRMQGREIEYRSYMDLQEAIADKQREVDTAKGLLLRSRRRYTIMHPRLGY